MKEINFIETRKQLVEKGMITQELCDKAIDTIVIKYQELRDGYIDITHKSAGVQGDGIFYKGIPIAIDLGGMSPEEISNVLASKYPNVVIKVLNQY